MSSALASDWEASDQSDEPRQKTSVYMRFIDEKLPLSQEAGRHGRTRAVLRRDFFCSGMSMCTRVSHRHLNLSYLLESRRREGSMRKSK